VSRITKKLYRLEELQSDLIAVVEGKISVPVGNRNLIAWHIVQWLCRRGDHAAIRTDIHEFVHAYMHIHTRRHIRTHTYSYPYVLASQICLWRGRGCLFTHVSMTRQMSRGQAFCYLNGRSSCWLKLTADTEVQKMDISVVQSLSYLFFVLSSTSSSIQFKVQAACFCTCHFSRSWHHLLLSTRVIPSSTFSIWRL
jgi:hypothetical protein